MSDEWALLKAILEQPDDDTRKLVYADWLEDHGDPRAQYLRLMLQVRREHPITPEQRQRHQELAATLADLGRQQLEAWQNGRGSSSESRERQRHIRELEGQLRSLSQQLRQPIPPRLQELAATLDPDWLAVVSDPNVERCGRGTGQGWRPRFDFVCDQSWADMRPTGDNKVRHCEACGKDVHFCDNLADAREHSQEGHCIAVDLGILRRKGDLIPPMLFAGQLSPEDLRQCYEVDLDPVSQARLQGRTTAGPSSQG